MAEIAASQDEGRNYTSELFRLKAANDEAIECLDIVKRENKNLADEIKDLLDQLGDGGRSIHDLDKQRRRLEQEKEELQAALEEAEGALEQEENKLLRKRRSSTTLVRTTSVPWNLWELPLKLNKDLRLRLFASRRSLRVTSMSLRLDLTMPTRPMLRV